MSALSKPAQEFYNYLKYSKGERTAYNYSRNVNRFLIFVDKPLEKITALDITNWYGSLEAEEIGARSINRFGWALRSFFELMNLPELKKRTPIVPYNPIEPAWMTEETTFKVIGKDPVLCTAYDLALRVGEVGLLHKHQFNSDTGDIVVTRLKHKGHMNTYPLRIEPWCLEILNRYLKWNKAVKDILFPTPVGYLQDTFNAKAKVAHAVFCQSCGTPLRDVTRCPKCRNEDLTDYSFQSLRHSKLTHEAVRQLEEKGVVDELSLSKFAGHLRVETTRLYIHLATKYMAFGRNSRNK